MLKHLHFRAIDYVSFAFIGVITLIAIRFVSMDTLGAYSDDSVSYVIMAQAMSPYFDTANVIIEASKQEQYPPLFSFFLALSGVSHSYLASHIAVALMFGLALLFCYWLAIRLLESRPLALAAMLIFALSPSVWLNILGILSENMYLALSLGFILLINNKQKAQPDGTSISYKNIYLNRSFQFSLLLTLVILCRSLGLALIAAYGVWIAIQEKQMQRLIKWRFALPLVTPLLASASWSLGRDNDEQDLYAGDVGNIFTDIFNAAHPLQQFLNSIAPQLNSFSGSWYTSLQLYWSDGFSATHLIISSFGFCALAGLALRLKQNQLDAWYVLFYLLILVVWPYPDQFNRFLYVLMPLLIIHGIYFIKSLLQRFIPEKSVLASLVASLFVFVSVLPASSFIYTRANYVTPYDNMDFSNVTPFYNTPDIINANRVAYRHEHLRQDLQKLNASVAPNDTIMWYTPNYIRLIAQRKAVRLPVTHSGRQFLQDVQNSHANYVFSSDLIPRYTSESFSGLNALDFFNPFTTEVWSRKHAKTGKIMSILLKIDQQKLASLINTDNK